MAWKLFSILVACLMALFVTTSIAHAQEKITGPWLWMIAPTVPGQGGARSINVDSLAVASNGAVTETDVATNGANEGDRIGNFVWTFGRISDTGGDNINQCLNRIGLAAGNMDDHSSYALFTFKSDTTRSNVTMRVGSDDAVKVWLNGKVVHNNPTDRGASDFQDRFQVDLRRGENLLMVKVSERTGGWSMFVGIDTFGGGDDGRVREPDFETPAQSPQQRPIVRLIYFLPKDREPQPDIDAKMDRVLKEIQQHYADEMERLGYGKKTFKLETGANGRVVVHRMKGNFNDADYRFDTFNTIANEINKQYDTFKNVYFVAANTATGFESYVSGRERVCGLGGHFTLVRSLDECFTTNYGFLIAAHELGHTFGLQHDFRNDTYLMSYSGGTDLSPCDAEWLDVHRAFNSSQATSDERATIEMLPPSLASPPNAIRFRFEVIDPDGLHQARLHTTTLSGAAAGFLELVSCKQLNGNPNSTAELVTTYLGPKNKSVSLQVIDVHGNFTQSREFSVNITSILPRPKVVSIPDANLAAAVRREIGNSITTHTMLNLRRLDARNHGITDLTGLEHAHNLRQVNLGDEYIQGEGSVNNNAVSDFSPLFGLAQLTDLNLSSSSLSDVSFLENLTQLTFVDLYSNTISDVSPLANLTQLTHLNLYSNTISDVSPLANLTQLTHLNLYNNAISDISPLANLTQLTSVDLYSNTISDVSPLANLTQLTYLRLGGNTISDVSPLANLTQLTSVDLYSNTISDVSPLANLTQLTYLRLGGNTISDVSPLANLTQLTYLELGNNAISDVSPLANLTQLTYLNLYNNAISDVSPLAGLNLTGTQWDSTGLDLKLNPLNYASINTHIPAMQARGIEVEFDPRTYPALDIISGTGQQAAGGDTLENPFVAAAIDARGTPMRGVAVTFAVIRGMGELTATTATTDASGRAETTLTLGPNPGRYFVYATAAALESSVRFIAIAVEAPKRITENVEAPEYIAEDVNGDGVVDVQDLVLVVDSLGETGQNKADVNGDGNVDIADVLLVAGAFEVDAAAPALHPSALEGFTEAEVQRLLTRARQLALTDPAYLRGIAVLEQLLALLLPRETTLLANYPNPFNPETWIPYQLAKPTEVTLHIYSVKGELVRTLALGHQPVGMYHSKSRAAYWDGRNEQGEKVASGVYFYTLSAGGFTPTRKMLVRK